MFENQDTNLFLKLIVAPPGSSMQVFDGSKEPLRGWVGLHGNDAIAAPLVEFRYAGTKGLATSVALLKAYTGTRMPNFRIVAAPARGPIQNLEIGLPDGYTDHLAWSRGLAFPIDNAGPFTTDGKLVWVRLDASGNVKKSFLLDGHYIRYMSRSSKGVGGFVIGE